jgi:hypothetical protein
VLLHGEFDQVEPLAAAALEIGRRIEPENAEGIHSSLMFWLRRDQGRIGELLEPMHAFASQYPHLSRTMKCGLALIYAELDRKEDAEREFQALIDYEFKNIQREDPLTWHVSLARAAETCCYLNHPHAAELYQLLLPFARRNIVVLMASTCIGSASRHLGLLATMLGRWPEAERHFNDALAMHAKLRARPLIARTQHDYARMLVARNAPGDRAQALDLLDTAAATARALGMQSLLDKVLASQAAINAEPCLSTPDNKNVPAEVTARETGGDDPLFRQEGEYWSLGWQGKVSRLRNSKGLHYISVPRARAARAGSKRAATAYWRERRRSAARREGQGRLQAPAGRIARGTRRGAAFQ